MVGRIGRAGRIGRIGTLWAVALAGLLAGCAVTHLQAPTITPGAVEPLEMDIGSQRFRVQVHVQNPNDRDLAIKSVSCTLEVEGVEVGTGASTAPFSVPAHGETDFDAIVTTNFAQSMPKLLRSLLLHGDRPRYHLSGWVNPESALLPPIPFSNSGEFNLK